MTGTFCQVQRKQNKSVLDPGQTAAQKTEFGKGSQKSKNRADAIVVFGFRTHLVLRNYDSLDDGKKGEPTHTHMQGTACVRRKEPRGDRESNTGTQWQGAAKVTLGASSMLEVGQ